MTVHYKVHVTGKTCSNANLSRWTIFWDFIWFSKHIFFLLLVLWIFFKTYRHATHVPARHHLGLFKVTHWKQPRKIINDNGSSFPKVSVWFCLLLSAPALQMKTPSSMSLCRSIQRTWRRSRGFWLQPECQQTEWSSSPLRLFMRQPGRRSAFWKVVLTQTTLLTIS